MDLVWLVRPGENEEFRHSLRSVTMNLPHRSVWVVGEPPGWFAGDVIGASGTAGHGNDGRFLAVQRALRMACLDDRISDPFVACDDDMFLLHPLLELPSYHRGRLVDFHSAPPYDLRAHEAAALLEGLGIASPLNYDLHVPKVVHKAVMLRALDIAQDQPADAWIWSLYGNLAGLGGEQICDPKAYGTHAVRVEYESDYAGPWLSSNSDSWEGAAGTLVRSRFPDLCPLERQSPPGGRLDVLSINAGADTGGVSWGLFQAFQQHALVNFGTAMLSDNYIRYPSAGRTFWNDTSRPYAYPEIYETWGQAQVLHLHNNLRTLRVFLDRGQPNRPFVLHHHGTEFRDEHVAMNADVASRGQRAVISTIDMFDLGTNLVWVPAPCRIPDLLAIRKPRGGRLRVGHAPTNRALKSTDAFLAACKGLDVEVVMVERSTWAQVLAVKATCDIWYDQVEAGGYPGGYGCNAVEAWAMGIPVVAGVAPRTRELMAGIFGPRMPFYEAERASIGDAIRALMDESIRAEYGALGHDHVQRYHSGAYSRAALLPVYRDLASQLPVPKKRAPVTTRERRPPPVAAEVSGKYDLVIRVGRSTEELRYAVRSLGANVPHKGLYTAGVRVPWLTCPRVSTSLSGYQHAQAYAILRSILRNDDLTPSVIIADDDMYALRPLTKLPALHCGLLAELPPRSAQRARAIASTLKIVGMDALCRDMHIPMLINRKTLAEQLDGLRLPVSQRERLLWQTLYGSICGDSPTLHPDVKVRTASEPAPEGDWVSTNAVSFAGQAGAQLRQLFPRPSSYER